MQRRHDQVGFVENEAATAQCFERYQRAVFSAGRLIEPGSNSVEAKFADTKACKNKRADRVDLGRWGFAEIGELKSGDQVGIVWYSTLKFQLGQPVAEGVRVNSLSFGQQTGEVATALSCRVSREAICWDQIHLVQQMAAFYAVFGTRPSGISP